MASKEWIQSHGYQPLQRQKRLKSSKTWPRVAMRQHHVAGAIVVVTVHPGDRHEVRKLPQENDREERPCFESQLTGRCGPPDQWRHGARNGSDQSAYRCFSFEWRIEKQV